MLHRFNAQQYPVSVPPPNADTPRQPHPDFAHAEARDFTRLYTNIPHALIDDTMQNILDLVFRANRSTHFIVTVTDADPNKPASKPYFRAKLSQGRIPIRKHQRNTDSRTTTHYLNLQDTLLVLRCLLQAICIVLGPHRVQQICGIPMGISPAPFIANLFLAWYEYSFLMQYHTASAMGKLVLEAFKWTKRYLDDLCSLRNRFLASLLFRWNGPHVHHEHGLHGIYPPELDIPTQHHPHLPDGQLPFLDILLVHQEHDHCSRYSTYLYDKRVQPAFAAVRLSRFVHASSCVNEGAKRNIFVSQFRRLQRIILDAEAFITEVAMLMFCLFQQDYPRLRLEAQCAQQVILWPDLFHVQRKNGLKLTDRILAAFGALRTRQPPPPPHPFSQRVPR
ncbi:hypothetical protein PLESTM_000457600 [Pleodorina starrii]|nr:hypothetical protein PLESTM_000457600 [Pleodorina starrii]